MKLFNVVVSRNVETMTVEVLSIKEHRLDTDHPVAYVVKAVDELGALVEIKKQFPFKGWNWG